MSTRYSIIIWLSRLRSLMATSKEEMYSTKLRYKLNFDERVIIPQLKVSLGSKVFAKKDDNTRSKRIQKLEPIATGTYKGIEVDDKTCVILRDDNVTESINLDRVVLAPQI